jgi:riboflavin transporter FmnP
MLRGSVFIYCALLGLYFLKKPLYRHHYFSMAPIFIGLVLVGIAFYLKSNNSNTNTFADMILGFVLLQVGQIFGAFAFVAEEMYLGDYEDLDPLIIVGWEGVWGASLWCVLLPIFQNIPCDNNLVCTNGVVEDTLGAIEDYKANPQLILLSVLLVLDVSLLNIAGVNVTKYGSSAQRTTCDLLRNFFVWIFFMVVPTYSVAKDKYEPIEKFSPFQLAGFLILTFGVLLYNEILVLPFWGLNQNTRIAIGEREKVEEEKRRINRNDSDNTVELDKKDRTYY